MASIGDVWLRISLEGTQLVTDAKKLGAKAGDVAGGAMSIGLKAKLSDVFKGGAIFGSGAALASIGFSSIEAAASKVTSTLQDMVKRGLEDEESQNRLAASLKANVSAWDGNTAAIEKNIVAKQRLGFNDEDLRNSLTLLLGATHDVAKAQEIQGIAMDLARFKGVDLQTASESLIKVEGGVYRSLKSLGIVLRDGATQTEALAAVQAVASGQAEAYANTNSGKLLASQIKVGEAMEHIGTIIMPGVVTATLAVADAADTLATAAGPAAEGLTQVAGAGEHVLGVMNDLVGANSAAAQSTDLLGSKTDPLGQVIHGAADAISLMAANLQDLADGGHRVDDMFAAQKAAVTDARNNMIGLGDDYRASVGDATAVGTAFDTVGDKADSMAGAIAAAGVSAARSVENMRNRIVKAAQGVIDGAYGNITGADALSATNAEINATRREIAMGGAASGTDRATASIDRQSKALDRASKAETAHTATLTAGIDKQIAALDLSERMLAIEDQRHSLNEQLNAAQLDLTKAQGGTDAQAISDAMAKVADIQAQQVENERKLTVAAQRDKLEAQKTAIQDASQARQDELTKLKAHLDEQRAAINTSGSATVSDAKARLHELFKTQADEVLALALAGHAGSKEVADALVDMKTRLKTATDDEKLAILATIKALQDLQDQAERTFVNLPGGKSIPRPVGAPGGPQARDRGDPVTSAVPDIVGANRRPEPFVPAPTGGVIPGVMSMGNWTSGGDITVDLTATLDGEVLTRVVSRRQADEFHH